MNEWINRWNSFNSLKALVHVPYWRKVCNGIIPSPLFLSIDPCGACNLNCPHCNAAKSLTGGKGLMSLTTIDKIVDVTNRWGTRAFCIAGGGEPLIGKNTGYLIDRLYDEGGDIAVITNGTYLDYHKFCGEYLFKCKYVGISVDAATNKTWQRIKGTTKYNLSSVFENIESLVGRKTEITYKYLLLPDNAHEVYGAIEAAKNLGCNNFHLRPGGAPWFGGDKGMFNFSPSIKENVELQIASARKDFENESFRIFAVTHKFANDWSVAKRFRKCWACYTTGYFAPDGSFGLCCDRRGDKLIALCGIDDCIESWGGEKHRQIQGDINVSNCPRCTYSVVNEIFENVIFRDNMMCDFF
jgi:MoaA/NifB/PqqE/SkfB family radical SAM enzyme